MPPEPEVDPVLLEILQALWEVGAPDEGLSLARLAKRTHLRQSTLRRHLTLLAAAGLVRVTLDEAGGGQVTLNAEALAGGQIT